MRKILANIFRLGSAVFRGSGFSELPFIKQLKNKIENSLRRNIPAFVIIGGHTIFLDYRDRLELSIRKSYEPYEAEIFKKFIRCGDIVADVGANIGYHTLTFARLVGDNGKVFAFEPELTVFAILEKNIAVNHYENIISPLKIGLSDSMREEKFYFDAYLQGSIVPNGQGDDFGSIQIDAISLDNFIGAAGKIDFIKIDVDGGEHYVLGGMKSVLKSATLAILMEYNIDLQRRIGVKPEEDFALLWSEGFEIYSLHNIKKEMKKIFDVRQAIGRNFLCLKNKKAQLAELRGVLSN